MKKIVDYLIDKMLDGYNPKGNEKYEFKHYSLIIKKKYDTTTRSND